MTSVMFIEALGPTQLPPVGTCPSSSAAVECTWHFVSTPAHVFTTKCLFIHLRCTGGRGCGMGVGLPALILVVAGTSLGGESFNLNRRDRCYSLVSLRVYRRSSVKEMTADYAKISLTPAEIFLQMFHTCSAMCRNDGRSFLRKYQGRFFTVTDTKLTSQRKWINESALSRSWPSVLFSFHHRSFK
jgi:hypothetical protein